MSTHTSPTAVDFHRVQELRRAAINDFVRNIATLLENVDLDTERQWGLSAVIHRHGFGDHEDWSELDADDPRWTLAYWTLTLEARGYGDQQRRLDIVHSLGEIGRLIDQMNELVGEQQNSERASKEDSDEVEREIRCARREMRSALDEFDDALDAWSRSPG